MTIEKLNEKIKEIKKLYKYKTNILIDKTGKTLVQNFFDINFEDSTGGYVYFDYSKSIFLNSDGNKISDKEFLIKINEIRQLVIDNFDKIDNNDNKIAKLKR